MHSQFKIIRDGDSSVRDRKGNTAYEFGRDYYDLFKSRSTCLSGGTYILPRDEIENPKCSVEGQSLG